MINWQIYYCCRNEQDNIVNFLRECATVMDKYSLLENTEFVVIDNASQDRTVEILCSLEFTNLRIIQLNKNIMYTGAVFTAICDATAEHILIVDGDGQFEIKNFIEYFFNREGIDVADLILGHRKFIIGGLMRKLGSRILRWSARIVLGFNGPDLNAGIRYASKKFIKSISGIHFGRLANPSLWYLAKFQNLSIDYIEIIPRQRQFGTSSVPWRRPFRLLREVFNELHMVRKGTIEFDKVNHKKYFE